MFNRVLTQCDTKDEFEETRERYELSVLHYFEIGCFSFTLCVVVVHYSSESYSLSSV